jgi:tetratricopeptide (TPR) repeat protein
MRASEQRLSHHSRAFPRPARRRRGRCAWLLVLFLFPWAVVAQQSSPPTWDPYQAHKNVEVGRFYLRKGRYDAAISRFREALRDQPDDGEAFLYLGEAYEKKGDPGRAIQSYREYLHLWPQAKNARKIRERIEKLSPHKQGGKPEKKPAGPTSSN